MQNFSDIKAVLFDLDGVLYVGNHAIDGAVETVNALRDAGLAIRFVTNTSTMSVASIQQKLNLLGFNAVQTEVMSAPQATIAYLKRQINPVCRLLLADDVKQDFAEFKQSDTDAKYIVVGDIGNAWTYTMLNEVFNCLVNGAQLIAIHKNRFWQTEAGLQMDIGAFITGLEYASNSSAMLMGKPAAQFFLMALSDLKMRPEQVLMVGDDIDSDIGGAQAIGIAGALVKTGKYRETYARISGVKPRLTLDSVAALPALFNI